MRVLVTGGAGFIGSNLTEFLLNEGHLVHCIDNFNDYYNPKIKEENLKNIRSNPNYRLFKADILDYDNLSQIFENNQYDIVVHLAARAGVRPSIKQPLLYEKVNVQGTMHLLELCKINSIKKFVFASSSSVYGANKKVPFSETDSVDNPISPYAATKKAGELVCYTYSKLYNISVNCLRFFTVYGPRQRPDMAIHKFTKLIDNGEPIPVFGKGDSRRDYTFVADIIQGIYASMQNCNGYNIYNLGESQTIELIDLISLLEEALGKKAILDFKGEQQGDVPITFADIAKSKTELGYNPTTNVQDGVKKFVDWYVANKKNFELKNA
jgi:UDP-glucuronate 4-epimerase